ncbi:hypothetical protein [Bordetella muralis]|uniref:hypothetical protein n=1 Tax=Bordetella muralis TaxID=1649130 RepID=UPI0039F0DB9A
MAIKPRNAGLGGKDAYVRRALTARTAAPGNAPAGGPCIFLDRTALPGYLASQFPETRSTSQDHALVSDLMHLGAPARAPEIQRAVLVAQALQAADIQDMDEAKNVLDVLKNLDFDKLSMSGQGARGDASLSDYSKAWRAAYTLSRTSTGYEALLHMQTQAAMAQGTIAGTAQPSADSLPTSKPAAQRMMLQALDHLNQTYPRARAGASRPAAVLERAKEGAKVSPTLALAAYEAALLVSRGGKDALSARQKGDYFAWRQNFRDDSPGSALAMTRNRLHKFMGKTMPRAGENRLKTFVPRLFGTHRSPMSALRGGTQDITQRTIAQMDKLEHELHDASAALLTHLQPGMILGNPEPEKALVELAAIHVWIEQGGFAKDTPNRKERSKIKDKAVALRDQLLREQANHRVRIPIGLLSTARSWTSASHLHASFSGLRKQSWDADSVAAWVQGRGPEDGELGNALNTWSNTFKTYQTTRLPAPEADQVHDRFLQVVDNFPPGGRLRLFDGNEFGGSTRGLSANLSGLTSALSGIPLGPRLDLRAERRRDAVFELGRGIAGTEFFFGTSNTVSHQEGAGLLVGYGLGVGDSLGVRAGANIDAVFYGHQQANIRGVSIRVPRRLKEDGTGYNDAGLHKKQLQVAEYLRSAAAPTGDKRSSADTWNQLASHFFEEPDISIGWTEAVDRNRRHGGSADVGAGVTFPMASLNAMATPLGVQGEWVNRQRDAKDSGGRYQYEQHRFGQGWKMSGNAGVRFGTLGQIDADSQGRHATVRTQAVGLGVTLPLLDRRGEAKFNLVRDDGRLIHRACIMDCEYTSLNAFRDSLKQNQDEWVRFFAIGELSKEQGQPSAQARVAATTRGLAELEKVRARIDSAEARNQVYFLRHRLREAVAKQIDVMEAQIAQKGAGASDEDRAAVDAAITSLLTTPESWMPVDLKLKYVVSNGGPKRLGIRAALHLNTITEVVGEHDGVNAKIGFKALDAIDHGDYEEGLYNKGLPPSQTRPEARA